MARIGKKNRGSQKNTEEEEGESEGEI